MKMGPMNVPQLGYVASFKLPLLLYPHCGEDKLCPSVLLCQRNISDIFFSDITDDNLIFGLMPVQHIHMYLIPVYRLGLL